MTETAPQIDKRNSEKKRLDVGSDFVDPHDRDRTGNYDGEIDQIQRVEEENGTSYRIWVNIPIDGVTYRLSRFLPTPKRFKEELNLLGVDLDSVDLSQGLDCSRLIGLAVRAQVEARTTKGDKLFNMITKLAILV